MKKIINTFCNIYKRYFYYKDVKQGFFNLYYWFNLIFKIRYWDSNYLLNIEEHYLKQMLKYFTNSNLVEDNDIIIRDIKICLSLIDIIKNEDEYISYVNIKNYKRFLPSVNKDLLNPEIASKNTIDIMNKCIFQQKAYHLYSKIKSYKMQNWWD